MKTFSYLWQYLAEFFIEWEMFQINDVEKIKTHFIFNNFFSENRAVYEILSKNVVEPERPQMIWRMHVVSGLYSCIVTSSCKLLLSSCFNYLSFKMFTLQFLVSQAMEV